MSENLPKETVSTDKFQCPKCNKTLDHSMKFCPICAMPIEEVIKRIKKDTPGKSKFKFPTGKRKNLVFQTGCAGLVLTLIPHGLGWLFACGFICFFVSCAILFGSGSGTIRWGLSIIVSLLLMFPGAMLQNQREKKSDEQKQVIADMKKKAESDLVAEIEKKRKEELKLKIPETYTKAMVLVGSGKYEEALPLFKQINDLDASYKDANLQLKTVQAKANKIRAANIIKVAKSLGKTDGCGEMSRAKSLYEDAIRLDPDQEKTAAPLLLRVKENQLACYEGNAQIQMAINIVERRPVTLFVHIKNTSGFARHANPNYFTLVTKSGESYPYSTKSFEKSKYFNALDLQPGTETSGSVVFDTYDAPRMLVYKELLGTQISRNFP